VSWSTQTPQATKKNDLGAADSYNEVQGGTNAPTETEQQVNAAMQAAAILAQAIGVGDDEVVVNLNGHSNPGHGPAAGWADEQITVSVRVQRNRPVPTEITSTPDEEG
jgi:hypothetical protein